MACGFMRRFAAVLLLAAFATPARAQDVATFYKGRTITILVGYGSGGGYDIYARVLSRTLGKHMPGNPSVIIQNMPGAGSLRAANYLYKVAPKDGSFIGTFARNMPLLGLRSSDPNVQFDARKFIWLGSSSSFANDAYVLIARRDASVKSIDEARRSGGKPLIMGSTADSSSSDSNTMAVVLRDMLGFNVKLIPGYVDSGQLYLAMERGEIEARTTALSALQANKPDWIKPAGPMQVMLIFGRATRHPLFQDVPLARELARTPEDRRVIEILEAPYMLSRPFAAPPDVPADRAEALKAAFMAAHKDPVYVAEAEKMSIDVSPVTGDAVRALIDKIAEVPAERLQTIEKLIQGGG